jgi:hypothetical protein
MPLIGGAVLEAVTMASRPLRLARTSEADLGAAGKRSLIQPCRAALRNPPHH